MTETAQPKRGGRAFHSILEPHFDFIRELRRRRKTWQEIAELLLSEKGIRVTLYAPYHFYQRQLKRRAKGHWEDEANQTAVLPVLPNQAVSRPPSRPSPLPPKRVFNQPNISTKDTENFI